MTNVDVLRQRAQQIWQNEGPARACETLRELLDLEPDRVQTRLNLAQALLIADAAPEAVVVVEAGLSRAPDEPAYHYFLAGLRMVVGDVEGALGQLDAISAVDGGTPQWLAMRAAMLLDARVQKTAEACALLEAALAKDDAPYDDALWSLLLTAQNALGKRAPALLTAQCMVVQGTRDVNALLTVAQEDMAQGRAAEVVQTLAGAGEHPVLAAALASAEQILGHSAEAARWESQALKGIPEFFKSPKEARAFMTSLRRRSADA